MKTLFFNQTNCIKKKMILVKRGDSFIIHQSVRKHKGGNMR